MTKASLVLIEQVILLLVFAIAAVLCLQAFVWADVQSQTMADTDCALAEAQSAAEVLKACHGDFAAAAQQWGGRWDGQSWTIAFDQNWIKDAVEAGFVLRITPCDSGIPYLGKARAAVCREEYLLVELDVCWQEVASP